MVKPTLVFAKVVIVTALTDEATNLYMLNSFFKD